jgi:enhancing lycopene biosynthesis protein 2
VVTPLEQACVDSKHRMISAPAYMYGDANPAGVFASIQAAVKALDEMLAAA